LFLDQYFAAVCEEFLQVHSHQQSLSPTFDNKNKGSLLRSLKRLTIFFTLFFSLYSAFLFMPAIAMAAEVGEVGF